MALFGRQVIFQVGQPGTTGRSWEGLRVQARVAHKRSREPNSAVITVYGLSADTIGLLQEEGAVVRVLAGYDVPLMLFEGAPVKNGVSQKRQGPERITTIEARDGLAAYQAATVSVSYRVETTLGEVFDEVAAQLGLPLGSINVARDLRFPRGIALNGSARDILDRIALMSGADWMIRDGVLELLTAGEGSGEAAVLFSSQNGNLIGAPTRKDGRVQIVGLLSPSLRPGKPFRVESEHVTGDFLAGDVDFEIDSWEGPFYVKATGSPL